MSPMVDYRFTPPPPEAASKGHVKRRPLCPVEYVDFAAGVPPTPRRRRKSHRCRYYAAAAAPGAVGVVTK